MLLCHLHIRQRYRTFNEQIGDSFFPIGLSQQNRRNSSVRIFRRDSTKVSIRIIFYIDFLCSSDFSYLAYIIGNTEKSFIPFGLLFFLFINNFYHRISHPFWKENNTLVLRNLSYSGLDSIFLPTNFLKNPQDKGRKNGQTKTMNVRKG